jgi:hypothetical protein
MPFSCARHVWRSAGRSVETGRKVSSRVALVLRHLSANRTPKSASANCLRSPAESGRTTLAKELSNDRSEDPLIRGTLDLAPGEVAAQPTSRDAQTTLISRITLRLSDAGMRCRQAKALYPNHRPPPWLTEDVTRDRSNRLLGVLACRETLFQIGRRDQY